MKTEISIVILAEVSPEGLLKAEFLVNPGSPEGLSTALVNTVHYFGAAFDQFAENQLQSRNGEYITSDRGCLPEELSEAAKARVLNNRKKDKGE
jgi:hypothetical protein